MVNTSNTAPNNIVEPYKELEFEEFLKLIGIVGLCNWTLVAEALGVNRDTIARWRRHPLARKAIIDAIQENIQKMTEVGATDWKMYREKLKMLGLKDKQTLEYDNYPPVSVVLDSLERTDYKAVSMKAHEALKIN